jgi:hypothetical protein
MIKKGLIVLPAKTSNEDGEGEKKKPKLARGTPVIHKAKPVPKLQKKEAIKLVDVGSDNIKITRPDDILTAEMIIRKREIELQKRYGGEI